MTCISSLEVFLVLARRDPHDATKGEKEGEEYRRWEDIVFSVYICVHMY